MINDKDPLTFWHLMRFFEICLTDWDQSVEQTHCSDLHPPQQARDQCSHAVESDWED